MRERTWILWCLRGLAAFLLVGVVSAGLAWGLAALGDTGGSAGARGIAYVAGACFFINLVVLVVLLAVIILKDEPPSRASHPGLSPPGSEEL